MSVAHALIVAGPTASGKSALAIALAERLNGVIINADSMQVYAELRIVTARPSAEDEARVPHFLFGVRAAAEAGSAAWWRGAALEEMEKARAAGRLPILCGGSGLYFSSLVQGMADIPAPGAAARAEARALLEQIGPVALHARLAEVDPETARKLRPTDSQRVARAWEVFHGTGHGIAYWQAPRGKTRGETAAPWRFSALLLDPPREVLREAIASRFAAMLAEGALEEVRALLALGLDPALPAMRAHGVPELAAHLAGKISLEEAGRRAGLVTGQYTKRQATWFRHHKLSGPGRTHIIHARFMGLTQFSERKSGEIFTFIQSEG
jgi:tRNA dimethylallyltransferase